MTTNLTRYLKLKVSDSLSPDAKYNLNKIDTLGVSGIPDATGQISIRSVTDILLEAESPDVGGSGNSTGSIQLGTNDNLANIIAYCTEFKIKSALNQATLSLFNGDSSNDTYFSIGTPTGTNANCTLTLDTGGSDRDISFSYNGVVVIENAVQVLTNKTISGASNTITDISPSALSSAVPVNKGGTGASNAIDAINALLPSQSGNADKVLKTDGTNVSWASPATGQVQTYVETWTGTSLTKTITHNLGTKNVDVTVRADIFDGQTDVVIYVDIEAIDSDNILLTSSEFPDTGIWTITIQGAP